MRHNLQHAVRCALGTLALLLGLSGPALSQTFPPDPADLAQLVDQLNANDLSERERATWQLREDESLALATIESVLVRGGLSPEQRERLLSVARARFDREPRAAMGIQFSGGDEDVIGIEGVIEGFDAARVLKPGDVIHSVNNLVLEDRQHLRAMILARDPGDPMTLGITRVGRQMAVTLTLGAFAALPQPARLDMRALDFAWMSRSSSYAPGVGTEVIECGLTEEGWQHAKVMVDTARAAATLDEQRQNRSRLVPDVSALRIGGEPRGGLESGFQGQSMVPSQRRGAPGVIANRAIAGLSREELNRLRNLGRDDLRREIIEVQGFVVEIRRRVTDYEDRLRDPGLKPDLRMRLQRILIEERNGLSLLEDQLQLMQEFMRPRR